MLCAEREESERAKGKKTGVAPTPENVRDRIPGRSQGYYSFLRIKLNEAIVRMTKELSKRLGSGK